MFLYSLPSLYLRSRDNSVGIALGYGLDDRGTRVRFPVGTGNFSLCHRVQNGSGAHPASYPMGIGTLSLEVKRWGREPDHSPPSSAEVKNAWNYTSTPPITFMVWCSVKKEAQGRVSIVTSNVKNCCNPVSSRVRIHGTKRCLRFSR
jgi:hypothetical protein